MRIVLDIECDALHRPKHIWLVVCKEVDTGTITIFRNITSDEYELARFNEYIGRAESLIGHNLLGYDLPVLCDLIGWDYDHYSARSIDTLILSKMADFSRDGHSVADYGLEMGLPKIDFTDFSQWSQELEDYCIRDVEITKYIYTKYLRYITRYPKAVQREHRFQKVVNLLHTNGFYFRRTNASKLLGYVEVEEEVLDKKILSTFTPKVTLVRTFVPKATKYNTISKTSVPRKLHEYLGNLELGYSYDYCTLVPFNPSSHKQILDVLNESGWSPIDRTAAHISAERELNKLKYLRHKTPEVDLRIEALYDILNKAKTYGYKVNETNLDTLPPSAPLSARLLAKRILLEARRRTLTEWLGLVRDDNRIHGNFHGIGAWTHRMAHQKPNTANIPNEFDTAGKPKLLGKEMRQLWGVPRNRLLLGVDAEGIQLRIFAHYIDDPEFTDALVKGKKDDKTDPHSLNQRILGTVCKSRAAAKRFIYALLLGAGIGKLQEILGCSRGEAEDALNRLLERYTGFAKLKREAIPNDAKRGYFTGLDGRPIKIPGDTEGTRRHLAMSGYLQSGEAIVMKAACLLWHEQLETEGIAFKLVNFVHDEWQTELANDVTLAKHVAEVQCDSLRIVGEELGLKCPLAGSYWNDDHKDYTIGTNWWTTH